MKALIYIPSLSLIGVGIWFFNSDELYQSFLYLFAGVVHLYLTFAEN